MSKRIPLTQGKFAIVDDDDFAWLSQWKWCAHKPGNMWYAVRNSSSVNEKRKTIRMHREVLGTLAGRDTDHLNRNGLDNRKENLVSCTRQANIFNTDRSKLSSRYFGVCFDAKRNNWRVVIRRDGKYKHIGYYKIEVDAARAYNKVAFEIHGTNARLNRV